MLIFGFTFDSFLNPGYLYNEYNPSCNVAINVYRNPLNRRYWCIINNAIHIAGWWSGLRYLPACV